MSDLRLVPAGATGWLVVALLVPGRSTGAIAVAVVAIVAAGMLIRWPAVAVIAVMTAVLAGTTGWHLAAHERSPVRALAERSAHISAVVEVRMDARSFTRGGSDTLVVDGRLRRVATSRGTVAVRERVLVFVPAALVQDGRLEVGTTMHLRGRLAPSGDTRTVARLSASRLTVEDHGAWWWRASAEVREGIRRAVAPFGWQGADLVPALVAGDEGRIDPTVRDDFARSGLTHLLAVSGTNLTIVLGAVLLLVRRHRGWILPAALLTVVAFVLVARPEPSVQRAALMGTIAVLGLGRGRTDGLRALALTVLLLLLVDPWLSRQAGFVLSVSATSGILILTPVLARRMERWTGRTVALAVAVPLAAHLACLPALAALSGEVSLVAVLANLVAAPAVAPATVAGLAGGLLAMLWAPLGQAAGCVAAWAAQVIVWSGTTGAGLDGAAVPWHLPWWVLALLLPWIVLATCWVVARPLVAVGLCCGLLVALVRPPQPGWPPEDPLLVSCDVGQGAATVVPVGERSAVLVDVGQEPGPIDRCLRRLGIDHIALLVLTHGDADHVGGWRGAVRGRSVDALMVGPGGGPALDVPRVEPHVGRTVTVGAVALDVLWPPGPQDTPNDSSIVVRVRTEAGTAVLTGDLGAQAQRRLAGRADVRADVMTLPHHGSADLWEGFVPAVGPRIVTISAGVDNSHGHPAPSALHAVRGRLVGRTDEHGDVAVVRRGAGFGLVVAGR